MQRHLDTRHFPAKLIYSPVINWATERVRKIVGCSSLVISHCHWPVSLVVSKIIILMVFVVKVQMIIGHLVFAR